MYIYAQGNKKEQPTQAENTQPNIFSFGQESAHSGPELRQIQTSPATMYSDLVWEETIPRV